MNVNLVMFAAAKEGTGCDRMEFEIEPGWTLRELKSELLKRWPDLDDLIKRSAFAVNQAYAGDQHAIQHNDEIGWIPPVSGG